MRQKQIECIIIIILQFQTILDKNGEAFITMSNLFSWILIAKQRYFSDTTFITLMMFLKTLSQYFNNYHNTHTYKLTVQKKYFFYYLTPFAYWFVSTQYEHYFHNHPYPITSELYVYTSVFLPLVLTRNIRTSVF